MEDAFFNGDEEQREAQRAAPADNACEQSKKWVFTYNDVSVSSDPAGVLEKLQNELLALGSTYIAMQVECAPTTGRHHVQGCALFAGNKRRKALCARVAAHWERMMGTPEQASAYCSKVESRFVTESKPDGYAVIVSLCAQHVCCVCVVGRSARCEMCTVTRDTPHTTHQI